MTDVEHLFNFWWQNKNWSFCHIHPWQYTKAHILKLMLTEDHFNIILYHLRRAWTFDILKVSQWDASTTYSIFVQPFSIHVNPLQYKGMLSCQVNQSARYLHRCLELAILMKTSTDNPSQKSMVLESFAKLSLGCQTDTGSILVCSARG